MYKSQSDMFFFLSLSSHVLHSVVAMYLNIVPINMHDKCKNID